MCVFNRWIKHLVQYKLDKNKVVFFKYHQNKINTGSTGGVQASSKQVIPPQIVTGTCRLEI